MAAREQEGYVSLGPKAGVLDRIESRVTENRTHSPGPLLGSVGRLDAQEGHDLLPESLVESLANVPEGTERQVVIVGAVWADFVQHAALGPMDSRPGRLSNCLEFLGIGFSWRVVWDFP